MPCGAEARHLQRHPVIAPPRYWTAHDYDADKLFAKHGGNAELVAHRRRVVPVVQAHEIGRVREVNRGGREFHCALVLGQRTEW